MTSFEEDFQYTSDDEQRERIKAGIFGSKAFVAIVITPTGDIDCYHSYKGANAAELIGFLATADQWTADQYMAMVNPEKGEDNG